MTNRTWSDGTGGNGSSVIDTARQQVQPHPQAGTRQQTQQKAGEFMNQARDQVVSQLDSQKERAAGSFGSTAEALRQAAQQLRDHNEAMFAQYLESAAGYVDQFSGFLKEKNVRQMIDDVEGFARREPALFVGGAFALGFLAARFLKSSSDNGMQSGTSGMPDYAAARGQREYAGSGPFTGPAHDLASMGGDFTRAEADYAAASSQDMAETAASGRAEIGMPASPGASSTAPGGTGSRMSSIPGSAGMAGTTTPGGTLVEDFDTDEEESTAAAGSAGRSSNDE
jgi:hypothetical protein